MRRLLRQLFKATGTLRLIEGLCRNPMAPAPCNHLFIMRARRQTQHARGFAGAQIAQCEHTTRAVSCVWSNWRVCLTIIGLRYNGCSAATNLEVHRSDSDYDFLHSTGVNWRANWINFGTPRFHKIVI